jgi:hypothetical protein
VLAADLLDLTLMPSLNDGYDADDSEGRKVEIKATTRNSVSLSSPGTRAERLVVLALDHDGNATIVYDGACDSAWEAAGKPRRDADEEDLQHGLPRDALQLFEFGDVGADGGGGLLRRSPSLSR